MSTVFHRLAMGVALFMPVIAIADEPGDLAEAQSDACDITDIVNAAIMRHRGESADKIAALFKAAPSTPEETAASAALAQHPSFYQAPRKTANAMNDSPTGGNGLIGALVSGAWNPAVLGLAIDSGLVSESGGAYSFAVTPFAWFALFDPTVNTDPAKYMELDWARRVSGKVTLGGKGEAFDRDSDGTVDEALEAESRTDIVTYELAWRFYGSRDRLDGRSPEIVQAAVQSVRQNNPALVQKLDQQVEETISAAIQGTCGSGDDSPLNAADCFCLQARIDGEAAAALADYEKLRWAAVDAAIRTIDSQWVWSAVVTGTEREAEYGGDKRGFGIRGSYGVADDQTLLSGTHHDFEFDHVRNELSSGSVELKGWKLGYKFSKPLSLDYGGGAKPTVLSLAGAVEKYSDAPATMKDSIAKLQIKWSVPLSEGVKVPLTLTWANRTELLADEGDVIAHLGFTIDFDAFKSLGKHE